jgi:chemotaxis protein CheX
MTTRANVEVEAAARAAAGPAEPRLEIIAPFVEAAGRVLFHECGEPVGKGKVHRVKSAQTANAVSAMIAVTGDIAGLVIYSMGDNTARYIAGKMMGEEVVELDEIGQSAIAELANIITGQAGIQLETAGFASDMSPPVLVMGAGATIATFNLTRVVVPVTTASGAFNIDIAVKEAA